MRTLTLLDVISLAILIIGGINWGIVGIFNVDAVAFVFGNMSALARVVYAIVGIAAFYMIYFLMKFPEKK